MPERPRAVYIEESGGRGCDTARNPHHGDGFLAQVDFGFDAGGHYNQAVNLNASAKTGTQKSITERYQRIPDQQLLLASGTIDRGTGVYYKFRQSNQTTLEGSHPCSKDRRARE